MESMGKKPRRRRSFTPEFKAEIVELCQRGDRSVGQVAKDFDLTETAVREWVKQAERDAGTRQDGGLTSAEREELAELRRENRRLREDVEILKRATAFLREGDPVNCYPFIEAEKAQQRNVKRPCELLKVSRAAYYAARGSQPSDRDSEDAELTVLIKAEHKRSKGRYGAPRIHAELRGQGRRHSRKRVARLMRQAGLCGKAARRWKKTTIPDPAAAARADAIRRDFTADAARINTRWCGDITYIATWEGWLYLATVIDIASRRVVGFALADHLRTELVADALANAVAARNPAPGVIFHSDRGCQRGTPPPHTPRWPMTARSPCPWDARASAGITPWRRASSPRSRASSSTPGHGLPVPQPVARSWSTSPGTTAPGCTAPWDTAAPPTSKTTTTERSGM
jgi:putative transposase